MLTDYVPWRKTVTVSSNFPGFPSINAVFVVSFTKNSTFPEEGSAGSQYENNFFAYERSKKHNKIRVTFFSSSVGFL